MNVATSPHNLITVVRPQEGPQEDFLSTPADIAIFGGAAFSGKSFALLMEPLRNTHLPRFYAVIFRRETPQIVNPGALWDESMQLYPFFKPRSLKGNLEHTFKSGAVVKFAHLEHKDSVYAWDGAQIPLIGFDQLEHFERSQFFYMMSRNRDPSGTVRPYVRATCNPDADSWLAEFIEWWIDQDTGFPIHERAGVIRYLVRDGDNLVWYGSRAEVQLERGAEAAEEAKSVTFIPGTIYDNKIGMKNDPSYLGTLKSLPRVERERLLGGNWKIRASAGLMFQRQWCKGLETEPADVDWVRYWDLAATEKIQSNDPDWTIGLRLGRYKNNQKRWIIGHVSRMRVSPHKVRESIRNIAISDGKAVRVGIPQDPGQAGKSQAQDIIADLAGWMVRSNIESGDKVVRFGPFSAQCEAGNVDYVIGPWNDAFFTALEGFPDGVHKDDADACSGALEMFLGAKGMGLYDYFRQQVEAAKILKKNDEDFAKAGMVPPDGGAAIMSAMQQ